MNKMRQLLLDVQYELLSQSKYEAALRLTALFFILRGFGGGDFQLYNIIISVICMLMLLSQAALNSRLLWFIVFTVMSAVVITRWHIIDNYQYLMAYWCLACGLAVSSKAPEQVLRVNGRLLIGLVFLFATIWKFLGGQYFDGSFFQYLFLTDERFAGLTVLVSEVQKIQLEVNTGLISGLSMFPELGAAASLYSSEALARFALFISYWVILIKGAVAVSFLLTKPVWLYRARHIFLIVFILSTYLFAPVDRFGITLAVLGFAQCAHGRVHLRLVYLLVFVMLQFARFFPDLLSGYLIGHFG